MSYREKSAWASLISLIIVYLAYFSIVFSDFGHVVTLLALGAAVLIHVTALSGTHLILALSTREVRESGDEPPRDERDVSVDLRSFRASSYVLGTAVMLWCMAAFAGIVMSGIEDVRIENAMMACQVLFAGFVLANITYYATQVVGYRRMS